MKTEEIKIEDLKIGETYNVRVKVLEVRNGKRIITTTADPECVTIFFKEELSAFSPVSPAPKYDPCRKFRKGDKVELKEGIDGRKLSEFVTGLTLGKIYTVEEDEKNHTVVIDSDNGLCRYSFVHLRLVTPVEELEPYSIDPKNTNVLFKYGKKIATFEDDDEAQELCDRLNAEHRKEQK